MAKGPAKSKPQKAAVFEQDSEESDGGSLNLGSGSEMDSDVSSDEDVQSEQEEEERPKYAQFLDDSDLESDSGDDSQGDDDDSEDGEEEEDEDASTYSSDGDDVGEEDLAQQMKQIPFSALMKARQQLDGSASDNDDEDDDEVDISDLEEDEFAQDRMRLAQARAGKQPQRSSSTSSKSSKSSRASSSTDEALEAKRREVRERLRQLSGGASTSTSTVDSTDNAWAESRNARAAAQRQHDLAKRSNKNAPTEVSSKRPVSRRRNVVDTPSTTHIRDPRFESLSGSVNKDLFSKSYSFLPEMFSSELSTLKKTLAKLKKQELHQAGPKAKSEAALAIREERAKVEAALRRAEGLAGERERRARESAVKGKIKKENKERVEKGMLPFYPKKSEVKQMLLKDKYDRLAGGAGGVDGKKVGGQEKKQLKKALERRRRKNAQKEKRDMPVGIGFAREGNAAVPKRKRNPEAAGRGGEGNKRTRF
ncbi:related to rRNA biogenesis protein RRP36 [Ustilago trichophora]|uniref:rRNA biogenesis protein RRP36 n=1 Tax=Ustilago trichophora TaxID=86804 RepID=A0A5C3DTK5_9BASI|nr:related to rRNA biogenesis protein RRP36 [Ustilago trichophora]